jgi:uncharacterized protein (TIGR02611 family)
MHCKKKEGFYTLTYNIAMKATRFFYRYLRKLIILVVGLPILIVGIIFIPLPGPGVLISLAGLLILSLEFTWPKKYVDTLMEKLRKIFASFQEQKKKIDEKYK